MNKAVEIRNALKKKKPNFRRQDSHKKSKLSSSWRKPKGSDSKMRVSKRGYCRSVSKGYKSPKLARGLTRDGYKIVNVFKIKDLENVDNKICAINISSTVGLRKKIDILKEALKLKLSVLNYKNAEEKLSSFEELIIQNKEIKNKLSKEKEIKQKEKEKVAVKKEEEKKQKENEEKPQGNKKSLDDIAKDEKEKKQEEKKEKDKLLINKDKNI
ncbi:MAG: 50S ribosomal protein L32e [Candidatus Woesearchaeota archaeon]